VATITFRTVSQPKVLPTTALFTIVDNQILNDDVKEVPSTVTNGAVQIARVAFDLQPSPVQVALGESFSVDMVVSGVDLDEGVTGMQFRVKYDSNLLQVTGVTEGPFLKSFGSTYFLYAIDDDISAYGGNVLVGDLLLPDANGVWARFPEGTGTVATIKFQNIGPRPKYVPTTTQLTIVDNLVVNDDEPTPGEVPSSVSSEEVQIGLPEPATLSIYPGQLYAVLGHPLVVSVMINNLKAAWRTVGIQFRLCYDPTLFEVVSVTQGSFMKDSRWNLHGTTFLSAIDDDISAYGSNVLVGTLLNPDDNGVWAAVASGFGVLATITLNPIHAAGIDDPPLTTTLTIENDLIVNDANEEIGEVLHTVNDAEVTILPIRPTLSVDPPLVEAHGVGTTFIVT
jgi:hypothetical protein